LTSFITVSYATIPFKGFMFRKVKKKAGKPSHLRRKRDEDADNENGGDQDNDDNMQSLHDAIRQTQKKQKILASLPLTSGGKGGGSSRIASAAAAQKDDPLQPNNPEDLSVLASKHKQNMEEFIEQQIEATTPKNKADRSSSFHDESSGNTGDDNHIILNDEEDLYQQLSREAYTGSSSLQNTQKDDDKGAGGAMLVGSGIAEVILPTDQRLQSSSVNNPAGGVVKNRNIGGSSSAVPKGSKEVLPLTTPTPFGRNMVQQQHQTVRQPPQLKGTPNDKSSSAANTSASTPAATTGNSDTREAPTTSDSARLGFDAMRGRLGTPTGGTNNGNNKKNNNQSSYKNKNRDDQIFSKFVKRQFEGNRR
ncbi:MAG: hypothetical protein SGILL_003217, partial [Bacillariaceae sp.]